MNTALALAMVNRALTGFGEETIASFTEGTPLSIVATLNYEPIVRNLLDDRGYTWSQRYADLTYLGDDSETRFRYVYQRPADCLSLRSVTIPGRDWLIPAREIEYMPYADKITCDYDSSSGVQALYAYRVEEDYWPPRFEALVVAALKEVFLASRDMFNESVEMGKMVQMAQRDARFTSTAERGGRAGFRSRLVAARRNQDR